MDPETPTNKKFLKEMTSGISSLVLLNVLSQGGEPMYGYQVARLLEGGQVGDTPLIKQGTLYPALRSLERIGLLSSEVEPSVSGPPRRYYSTTPEGERTLAEWTEIWQETKAFVDAILKGEIDGSTND